MCPMRLRPRRLAKVQKASHAIPSPLYAASSNGPQASGSRVEAKQASTSDESIKV
eukprot:CAMPEP_0176132956 /NCGR_PEP_ID=MMETSP0120_2-20121206/67377_1 /TAXON_ID=160619 /ORGANISM="Kryptoperidinium foliaceum, Strain CCMP 1326" /LENGTH=54 /DNA_ID=CAMNT_0017468487 /DNA_START=1 /DNA_END=162 /DNA_ORIENTATION=+